MWDRRLEMSDLEPGMKERTMKVIEALSVCIGI